MLNILSQYNLKYYLLLNICYNMMIISWNYNTYFYIFQKYQKSYKYNWADIFKKSYQVLVYMSSKFKNFFITYLYTYFHMSQNKIYLKKLKIKKLYEIAHFKFLHINITLILSILNK
jgi:hypothetical protein